MIKQSSNHEIEGNYYIKNDQILALNVNPLNLTNPQPAVYEVIRVMDRTPLFLEDHLQRLQHSVNLLGHSHVIEHSALRKQIHRLIEANQLSNKNLKLLLTGLYNQQPILYYFFIPSHYPAESLYQQGVTTILYTSERNQPNVKAVATEQRNLINAAIAQADAYEALLVNQKQQVTEGSRSNLFVIKDGALFTPPLGDVLPGITRSKVISLCKKLHIPLLEKEITVAFLQEAEGIFLTGTSPKVLPIAQVDQQRFPSPRHPLILDLILGYDQMTENYISTSKASQQINQKSEAD